VGEFIGTLKPDLNWENFPLRISPFFSGTKKGDFFPENFLPFFQAPKKGDFFPENFQRKKGDFSPPVDSPTSKFFSE